MMKKIVQPRSWDHRSKMRLIEHGPDWEVITFDVPNPSQFGMVLLQSVKDGYLKWWPKDLINV